MLAVRSREADDAAMRALIGAALAIGIAAATTITLPSGAAQMRNATTVRGWWWTPEYAEQRAALRAFGDANYFGIACSGRGARRYYAVRAVAVGPSGQSIGSALNPNPEWKWQRFRCLHQELGGWTIFDLVALTDYGFTISPPRGVGRVVTKTLRYP